MVQGGMRGVSSPLQHSSSMSWALPCPQRNHLQRQVSICSLRRQVSRNVCPCWFLKSFRVFMCVRVYVCTMYTCACPTEEEQEEGKAAQLAAQGSQGMSLGRAPRQGPSAQCSPEANTLPSSKANQIPIG